jgi:hypothetical protein
VSGPHVDSRTALPAADESRGGPGVSPGDDSGGAPGVSSGVSPGTSSGISSDSDELVSRIESAGHDIAGAGDGPLAEAVVRLDTLHRQLQAALADVDQA